MKRCTHCGYIKDDDMFSLRDDGGLRSHCKECNNLHTKLYERTPLGLSTKLYNSQKKSSRKRGMVLPNYTLHEFRTWLFTQDEFDNLYTQWKTKDFDKEYTPSTDRIDDYLPYTFDNIQLMTWKHNRQRYITDVIIGINNKQSMGVIQLSLCDEFINEYHSINDASRKTNINSSHISKVCRGIRCSSGGYKWKYKKDYYD